MSSFGYAGGDGSRFYPSSAPDAVFSRVLLDAGAIVVADAHADPADIPSQPQLRAQVDATGKCGIFLYSAQTGWVAVSLS